jgi:TonB family protein
MNLLLDSALKATVILFAAWTASLALRRASADVRHIIWLMATLAVALLPAVAMLPAALSIPQSAIPAAVRIVVPAVAGSSQVGPKLPWLLIVWAAGASIMLLRLLAGIASAARITRSAKNIGGILYSDRAQTPMTWGFLRPVVILPSYAIEWTPEQRDLVIRHEHAHIARHDWLWQILASVTTAVFWFHPLMWLANIQLRREAEGAVDDCVLANGVAPSDYAGRLVDVARHLQTSRTTVAVIAAPAAVIPMIRKPELETRVRSILDPSRRRAAAGILMRCAVALAALALIFPIALTRQSVHAQGKVYKMSDGVTAPSIIRKVEPEYTPEAKADKIEGMVVLQMEIMIDGSAQNIRVTRSLDPGLDQSAVNAVSMWQFKPGMKDGQPVTVAATIEVNFHLL